MNSPHATSRLIVEHRRARFDYVIEETYEAGIALLGWEVKSIRAHRIHLEESYCLLRQGELWWVGGHLSPLPNVPAHIRSDPLRSRRLLLHRHQIRRLIGYVERQGKTLIPLSLYWKDHHIKLKLALAQGRKSHDKRQAIKDREAWKSMRQKDD